MGRIALRKEAQHRTAWAVIDVHFSVVAEVRVAEHSHPLADGRERHVGVDVLPLDGGDVLDGAVLRVARDLPWAQFPAEARVPQQIERRLVLLHLRRRDQGGQDDSRFAAIGEVVVQIAQSRASIPVRHRRGVGIGGADAEIGCATVRTAGL